MPLMRKIRPIGNSMGIILPRAVLAQLNWEIEAEVELKVEGKKLIMIPCRRASMSDEEIRKSKRLAADL